MKIDRRRFMKIIMGPGMFAFAAIPTMSYAPRPETTEERIKRLFSMCNSTKLCQALPLPPSPHTLRQSNSDLSKLSDKDFLMSLDENIRQDFANGNIIALEGWQLSHTETIILTLVA